MTRAPLLLEGPKRRAWGWIWGWVVLLAIVAGLWWGSHHIWGPVPDIIAKERRIPTKEEEAARRLEGIAETQVRESLGTLVKHRDKISPTEEIATLELPPSARGDLFEPGFSNCIIYKNSEYRVVRFVCVTKGVRPAE